MRRTLFVSLIVLAAAAGAEGATSNKNRVSRYFEGWYSFCPGTQITVTEANDVTIAGYQAYRVERHCELKNRNEMNIALVDAAKNEIFVGEVMHSSERRGEPFSAEKDIPALQAVLKDAYGVPVSIEVAPESRGALIPIRVRLSESAESIAAVNGFVSQDGATLLVGEFRQLGVDPAVSREKFLAEPPHVRNSHGTFFVTAMSAFT